VKKIIILLLVLISLNGCLPIEKTTLNPSALFLSPTKSPSITLSTRLSPSPTLFPVRKITTLPTINENDIPQWIIDEAKSTDMTPSEIMYVYNAIRSAARDKNPYPLLDFLQFPLHKNGRCPGDVIETPEEFVNRFPEFLNDRTREIFMNFSEKSIITDDGLVGFVYASMTEEYSVWFGHVCKSINCSSGNILLFRIFDYITWWQMVEGYSTHNLLPTYNQSLFKFGRYEAISYKDVYNPDTTELDETLVPWRKFSITISETSFTIDPFQFEGSGSCEYQMIESCPLEERNWAPGSDGNTWPYLQIVCDEDTIYPVYILDNNEIAFQLREFFTGEATGNPFIIYKLV
jgi:hypothetical protein